MDTNTPRADEPQIFRVLDASSNHLPFRVFEDLDGYEDVTAHETGFGWLLHVPADVPDIPGPDDEDDDDSEDLAPAEVLALWQYAKRHDCTYIMLDRDADTLPGFPIFDW